MTTEAEVADRPYAHRGALAGQDPRRLVRIRRARDGQARLGDAQGRLHSRFSA